MTESTPKMFWSIAYAIGKAFGGEYITGSSFGGLELCAFLARVVEVEDMKTGEKENWRGEDEQSQCFWTLHFPAFKCTHLTVNWSSEGLLHC